MMAIAQDPDVAKERCKNYDYPHEWNQCDEGPMDTGLGVCVLSAGLVVEHGTHERQRDRAAEGHRKRPDERDGRRLCRKEGKAVQRRGHHAHADAMARQRHHAVDNGVLAAVDGP